MRPKTAVKLLLAVSAILFLCVLFLSLLKEFFHDMRHNAGQQQAPLAAVSWPFITEAVDSDSPATFSPPKSFIWKGFDNNVAEVKELKGKKWVVSYRAKPTATEEGEKIVEGTLGSHEGVRHVEGLGGLKDVERRRPPVRTLETLEELPSSIPEKDEPRVIVLRKTIEPLDPAAQPSWQELDTSKPFQMKASESVSPHTLPPAVSYSSKRDSLQQQQTKPHASTSTPSGPANITHTGRDFSIKSYLSVPLPTFTRKTVLQDNWVRELQNYLRTLKTKQVSIVTANDEHEVVVLNWLISAIVVSNFSLENTLVLSLSQKLTSLLQSKNIPVVFVDPKSVISNSAKSLIRSGFSQVHIVRLTFFRLINHWGYDLVWYDSDATVLKNPQPLFDKYPEAGLVGSAGQGPSNLAGVWGRTICTGVLLMRSSQKMELYWEKMSQISKHPFTDQGLVNLALKAQHIQWYKKVRFSEDQRGQCDTGLRATILSEEVICRFTCVEKKRNQYYVWHKPAINRQRTVANKMERAQSGHAWFLSKDWRARKEHTGIEWLRLISENTSS